MELEEIVILMLVNPVSFSREACTYYLFDSDNLTKRLTVLNGIKQLSKEDYLLKDQRALVVRWSFFQERNIDRLVVDTHYDPQQLYQQHQVSIAPVTPDHRKFGNRTSNFNLYTLNISEYHPLK